MATSKIVFFDLASQKCNRSWSANTLKTRMNLNYKGLDYETEWLEYPEIKSRLGPHLPDKEMYTVPTVRMPDGRYITDSWEIAQELEKLYPTRPVNMDESLRERYLSHFVPAFNELIPNYILAAPKHLLNEASRGYWHETRSAWFGMPLEQFVQERGGEKAFKAAVPHLLAITELLKETEGPFFMGQKVSFVDFIHAGFFHMVKRVGDGLFVPTLEATGDPELHLRLIEAMEPYIERDSY
ncbi:putative glutathione S-transferase [Xylaria nigripes]|nr:putative glutathione S-transferase [Xylaria nigripes]